MICDQFSESIIDVTVCCVLHLPMNDKMVNLALSKAVCFLQFGEIEILISTSWISSILASLVASLKMTDFSVPEFAHFGKRVILKVGADHSQSLYLFLIKSFPSLDPRWSNDSSFSCYLEFSHNFLSNSRNTVKSKDKISDQLKALSSVSMAIIQVSSYLFFLNPKLLLKMFWYDEYEVPSVNPLLYSSVITNWITMTGVSTVSSGTRWGTAVGRWSTSTRSCRAAWPGRGSRPSTGYRGSTCWWVPDGFGKMNI